MIGKIILHYKIIEQIGQGGMGVVYKALDTKLNRTVAIKVLPPHLLISEDDRSRFNREARAAAALNHPNIATVYEINEHENMPFIVMEFIEGKTLNENLQEKPFQLKEVLSIAVQIAEGLNAAHEKQIIHRDIKSGNILLSGDGQAKILDFGLAKTALSTKLTQMGSTLGTVAYMSPEQVSGREVDQRTDLWSLGVVIFEMISGRLPFLGDYDQAIFYSIMNEPPEPLTGLRTGVPMSLEWIVNKLLAKDPAERYQNATDLIIDLKAVDLNTSGFSRISSSSTTGMPTSHRSAAAQTPPDGKPVSKTKAVLPWIISGLLLCALLVTSFLFFTQSGPGLQTIRTSITTLNSDMPVFTTGDLEGGHFALSPDGTLLAYVAEDSTGKSHLWVRRLDALSAQKLSGTEGAYYPFWSADDRFIAFFASGKLKKINAAGGPALTICDVKAGRSGTWNSDNIILFAPDQVGELFQVAAGGGTPKKVTRLDSAKNERTHRWPFFLPDGNHFLYFARHSGTNDLENDAIYISALDGSVNKVILNARTNIAYANNYILFVRDNTLMARRFDPGKLDFIGDARPIAENLKYTSIYSKGAFTISQNGLLIYQTGTSSSGQNLTWYDQKGRPGNTIGAVEAYRWVNISPDQKKATISIYDAESRQEDLWIHDFSRDIRTRFTFDQAYERMAVWSPDNETVVFNSNRGGKSYDLYQKNASGSGETTLLFKDDVDKYPTDWTSDGRFITYTSANTPKTKWDLWILPMDSEQKNTPSKPYPFLNTEFSEGAARFSPDGKWIAYFSDESGQDEIYVRPFPGPGGKWQVSIAGGYDVYWREDGREIYYISNDNQMIAVEVKGTKDVFGVSEARVLFDLPTGTALREISKDGQRFILRVPLHEESGQPLTLVTNWDKELSRDEP